MRHQSCSLSKFAFMLCVCSISLPVSATPCVVLQYEELKDMSISELTTEYCSAIDLADDNTVKFLELSLYARPSPEELESLSTHGDECRNQAGRIARVLQRKGVDHPGKKLREMICKKK